MNIIISKVTLIGLLVHSLPILLIWIVYMFINAKKAKKVKESFYKAKKTGMMEPSSLHPIIDHNICLGCGSCINSCPEQKAHPVLGLISNKSHLIGPSLCIGHGACKDACPHGAITLVYGTKKHGVDIPVIAPNFETSVSGIFIAGELGGMGLIHNAINQGNNALKAISNIKLNEDCEDCNEELEDSGKILDLLIVGAGPAGFSASLAAKEKNLNFKTIEQATIGGAVAQFSKNKLVLTTPVLLPTYGKTKFKELTKEKLLDFWQQVEKKSGVKINYSEKMESIVKEENVFTIKTSQNTYRALTILLAIGRRGTPRKLNVPGEDKQKVSYSLNDPDEYKGQHVLVVGGGDSAVEVAMNLSNEQTSTVTLSYRGEAFSRIKEKNREKLKIAEENGSLQIMLSSNLKNIHDEFVEIDNKGTLQKLKNDSVIINAGGVLPTAFLKKTGIKVETKYGTP